MNPSDIWEFFFCPVHGVCRMEMWPYLGLMVTPVAMYWNRCKKFLRKCRKGGTVEQVTPGHHCECGHEHEDQTNN